MSRLRPLLVVLLVGLAAGLQTGCGGSPDELADRGRERVEELRERGRELRERLRERVRERLEELERTLPAAGPQTRPPRRGDASLEAFLTEVLTSVDRYWTTTLRASGFAEPRVGYRWLAPGERLRTACGATADDDAALYCPADDTIYLAQVFAASVLQGVREDFPGTRAGEGRAVGDFGVAYIVAHEYAHNVQQELGFLSRGARTNTARPFELQADCMAGAWGNSVYREGRLEEGDVEEALATVKAVGDFEYASEQHHGTPDERSEAWLRGYRGGDPSACQAYLPT